MKLSGRVIWLKFGLLISLFFLLVIPKYSFSQNLPPVIGVGIPTQHAEIGSVFSYAIAPNAFKDANNEALTYSVTGILPNGITFNGNAFIGTPQAGSAATYNLTVIATDPAGSSSSTRFKLEVHNPGTYAAFTMNTNHACSNASVNFVNLSKNATSYRWILGNGNEATVANPGAIYDKPGNYTVTLEINNGASSYTDIITIYPKPKPDFISDITAGCEPLDILLTQTGSPQTIAATEINGQPVGAVSGGADVYYNWHFHTKLPDITSTSSTAQLQNVGYGNYNIVLTTTDANGCSGSVYKNNALNVYAVPRTSFSYIKEDDCKPSLVNFTNQTTVPGSVVYTQKWFVNGTQVSTSKNLDYTFTTTGEYIVGLEATSGKNCVSARYNDTIRFNTGNSANFTISKICLGDTTRFAATSSGAIGYEWDFDDDGIMDATGENVSFKYPESGLHRVQLTARFNDGCSVVVPKEFIINEVRPVLNYTFNNSCYPNVSIQFNSTGTTTISGNIASRQWYLTPPNGTRELVSTSASFTYNQFAVNGIYTMELVVTNADGCTASVEKQIDLSAAQISILTSGLTTGCIGSSTLFTAKFSKPGDSPQLYAWDFDNNGTIDYTSSDSTATYTYPAGKHSIKVTITTSAGCAYSATAMNRIDVAAKPTISAIVTQTDLCFSTGIDINATYSEGTDSLWYYVPDGIRSATILDSPTQHAYHYYFPDTGTYAIEVYSVDNGCPSDPFPINNIVIEEPRAAFTASQLAFCDTPYVVTFVNTSSYKNPSTTFLWEFGDGVTSTDKSVVHEYSSTGNFDVKLTVSTSSCSHSYTETIGIYKFDNQPGIISTVTPATGCRPLTVQFNQNITSYLSDNFIITSYVWYFGDGAYASGVGEASPIHTYNNPGDYPVTLIVEGSGCNYTFTDTLVHVHGPIPNITYSPDPVCNGGEVSFFSNVSKAKSDPASIANYTYIWDFGDNSTSSAKDPKHTFNADSTYTVILTITDQNSCSNADTIEIAITPLEALFESDTIICAGFPLRFTNLSSGMITNYRWNFGDGTPELNTSDATNPEHTYTPGNYQVSLTTTGLGGCNQTYAKSIHVSNPTANFWATETDLGCAPQRGYFFSEAQPDDVESYTWYFGNEIESEEANPSILFALPGKYTVTLVVKFKGGCTVSKTIPDMISVKGAYGVFTYDNNLGCLPNPVLFEVSDLLSVNSIEWDFGDGNKLLETVDGTPDKLQTNYTYTNLGVTIPYVMLYDSTCDQPYAYNSDMGEIYTSSPPVANFGPTLPGICEGVPLEFRDSSVVTDPQSIVNKWEWKTLFQTSNLQNPKFTFQTQGVNTDFAVTLIATTNIGCSDTITRNNVVRIYASDNLQGNFTLSDDLVCAGQTVSFTSNATSTNGAITNYRWAFGDGTTAAGATASHLYPKDYKGQTLNAYSIVTDDKQCIDSTLRTIHINNLQAAFVYEPQPVYRGSLVSFYDNSISDAGTTVTNYNWAFENGNPLASTNKDQQVTFETIENGLLVSLIVKNDNSCTDTTIMTLNVSNNPPSVFDVNVSFLSDTKYTFNKTQFETRFNPNDPSQFLDSIQILSLPQNITIDLDGVLVFAGQKIPVNKIDLLHLTPASKWTGTTSFLWSGTDGIDYATSPANVFVEVTPYPEPAHLTNIVIEVPKNTTVIIPRDSFENNYSIGDTWKNLNITMRRIDIVSLPLISAGSFTHKGNPVKLNDTIAAEEINLAPGLVFAPTQGYSDSVWFLWSAVDNYNHADTAMVIIRFINQAPEVSDISYTLPQSTPITIVRDTFLAHYFDGDNDAPARIEWLDIPASSIGNVQIDGVNITQPTYSKLFSGFNQFRFIPAASHEGEITMKYVISDGTDTDTASIVLRYENTVPIMHNFSKNGTEDTDLYFASADFTPRINAGGPYEDADIADNLSSIRIVSLPQNGVLFYFTNPITIDAVYPVTQIGNIYYRPNKNWFGNDSIKYNGNDGTDWAINDSTIHLIMAAVNDAPTAVNDTFYINEDEVLTGVSVRTNDFDVDNSLSSLTTTLLDGGTASLNGTIALQSNGNLTYTPTEDFNGKVWFTYRLCDPDNACSVATVFITIDGLNDPPTARNNTYEIWDDQTESHFNCIVDNDAVAGQDYDVDGSYFWVSTVNNGTITPLQGVYGALHWLPDGSLSYFLNAQMDTLAQGEKVTDTFRYKLTDDSLAVSGEAFIYFVIKGKNTPPNVTGETYYTNEDEIKTVDNVEGLLKNDSDLDGDDYWVLSVMSDTISIVQGNIGKFYWKPDGSFVYRPDSIANTLKYLETFTEVFVYTVTDQYGETNTDTVKIVVAGLNDPPTAVNDTITRTEKQPPFSDNVKNNDYDIDGDAFDIMRIGNNNTGSVVEGEWGTIIMQPSGDYTYAPKELVVAGLKPGETGIDSFRYVIRDINMTQDTAWLFIRIEGSNDAPSPGEDIYTIFEGVPSISTPTQKNILENDFDAEGDVLRIVDVDGIDNSPLVHKYGIFHWDERGNFIFNQDTIATNSLKQDSIAEIRYRYTATDGDGYGYNDIVIQIIGLNDAPTANNNYVIYLEDWENISVPVNEPEALLYNDTEPDDGDFIQVTKINGTTNGISISTIGKLEWNADGSYTYTPDAALVNALPDTATLVDSFLYVIHDNFGATDSAWLIITIYGANDAPFAEDDYYEIWEDNQVTTRSAETGILSNDEDPDNNPLKVILINGLPDRTTIGRYGKLEWDALGAFTYTSNLPQIDTLTRAEMVEDRFTYVIEDESDSLSQAKIILQIKGQNDPPTVSRKFESIAEDEMTLTRDSRNTGILRNDTDIDGDEFGVYSINNKLENEVSGRFGTLLWDWDGKFIYTLNPEIDSLHLGESVIDTFLFVAKDRFPGFESLDSTASNFLIIRIDGQNDKPIAVNDTIYIWEDTLVVAFNKPEESLLFNDRDIDGDPLSVFSMNQKQETIVELTFCTLYWDKQGNFTYYRKPEAIDSLPLGNTAHDSVMYTINDVQMADSTAWLHIYLKGQNDAPVANRDEKLIIWENSEPESIPAGNGILVNDYDIDNGDTFWIDNVNQEKEFFTEGIYGSLTWSDDGSYTYSLDHNATDTLSFNEKVFDKFPYQIVDQHGAFGNDTIVITIFGRNDDPVALNDSIYITEADTLVEFDCTQNDGDVDGDAFIVFNVEDSNTYTVNGNYGSLTWAPSGQIQYKPYPEVVDTLQIGDIVLDKFYYILQDVNLATSNSAYIHIFIEGLNDAPVANNDFVQIDEDTEQIVAGIDSSFALLSNDTDVDKDVLNVILVNDSPEKTVQGTYGDLHWEIDGTYTFVTNLEITNRLALGDTVREVYTYIISDEYEATDSATLNIEIIGVNDAPVAVANFYMVLEYNPLLVTSTDDTLTMVYNDYDVDGLIQVVTAVNQQSADTIDGKYGILIWKSDGTFTYLPDSAFAIALREKEMVTDTFLYNIEDEFQASDSSFLYFNIIGKNNAPFAKSDTLRVSEDALKAELLVTEGKGLLKNDTDPDKDILKVILMDGDTIQSKVGIFGELFWNANGDVVYTPNRAMTDKIGPGKYETETFTYTITDEGGLTSKANLIVYIIGENDPLIAVADTVRVYEDSYVLFDPTENDIDPDNYDKGNFDFGSLDITIQPKHGRIEVNTTTGFLFYQPKPNYFGHDTLRYRICDTEKSCSEAWVFIQVLPVNDAPIGRDTTIIVQVAQQVSFDAFSRVTDIDDGVDYASISVIREPKNGRYELNKTNGTLSYSIETYVYDYEELVYLMKDKTGDTAFVFVTYIIQYSPDYFAQNDYAVTPEDVSISVNILDNDTIGGSIPNPISVEIKNYPLHGTATYSPTNGLLIYVPEKNFTGTDRLIYSVCPTSGPCDMAMVFIEVTPVNDAIIVRNDAAETTQGTPVVIKVLDNDTDPDGFLLPSTLVVTLAPSNGIATVNTVTGQITYTPNDNYIGSDQFIYTVCDNDTIAQSCGQATVYVLVKSNNSNIIAENDTASTIESTAKALVNKHPIENDKVYEGKINPATFIVVQEPKYGKSITDNSTPKIITYTPEDKYYGFDRIKYEIRDEVNNADLADINIWVAEVNDIPVAMDDRYPVTFNEYKRLNVLANDKDTDGYLVRTSLGIVTAPKYGSVQVDKETGTILYKPNINNGTDTFRYTICDNDGACTQAEVTVNINLGTTLVYYQTTYEDTPDTIDLKEQLAKYNLTVTVDKIFEKVSPEHGSILLESNKIDLVFTPQKDYFGKDFYLVQIANDQNIDINMNVFVTVLPVNDAPVAVNDTITWNEGKNTTIIGYNTILKNDYDVDDSIFHLTPKPISTGFAMDITFNPTDSTIIIKADTIYWCDAWFTYEIKDSAGLTDTGKVLIFPVLNGITAVDDMLSVNENSSKNILDVLANDLFVYNQRCTIDSIKILEGPFNGSAEPTSTKDISYTPKESYYGLDSLRYQIIDTWGQSSIAWVQIEVIQVNTPPVAEPDQVTIRFGEPIVIRILDNDKDPDPDGFIDTTRTYVSAKDIPQNGILTFDPKDGTFTYTMYFDNCEGDKFTYTIFDNEGDSATAVVTINVPSEAPVYAIADTVRTYPGVKVEIDPMANDSGYFFPGYVFDMPKQGTANVDGNFIMTYYPTEAFIGSDSFLYSITTPCGNSASAFIFVMVEKLRVPEIITPNGDGYNDVLIIDGIENYPESVLQIYNRLGHIVYEKRGYDNSFDGFSNKGSLGGGKPLPSANYYYTLVYNKGYNKQAGRIYIFR